MLLTDKGYLNFDHIMKNNMTFNFIIGGRGCGKTFGAIQWVLSTKKKFIFMRRTQMQIDLIRNPALSPFKPVNDSIVTATIAKNLSGIYYGDEDGAKGPPIGYMCALSTISNIRGFDASDVDYIIYDEFIGEAHEKKLKEEGQAFLNAYETINRNRELNGVDPVRVIALANSNQLANPLFIELGLVSPVEKMYNRVNPCYTNVQRSINIYLINSSPVLDRKKETALYRAAASSEFSKMSLENKFTKEEMDHIQTQDLKQYKLLCTVGEIAIYKHKSFKTFYITDHISGTAADNYTSGQMDLKRWKRDYYYLWLAYLNGKILFESYIQKVLFENYFA